MWRSWKEKKGLIISEDFLVFKYFTKKKNRFYDDNLVISHAARVIKKNNQLEDGKGGMCVCVKIFM